MVRSTRRDTDFNIRQALKRTRSQLLSAQESGRAALASYEELAPQYNRAVEQARNFQSTLTRDYNRYLEDSNTEVSEYNHLLINRRATLQTALRRQEYLDQLEAAQPELQRQASALYSTYQKSYQDAVSTGSAAYEKQLRNTKYARDVTADQLTRLSPGSADYQRVQSETARFAKELEDLVADTGFVTRFAQSQSAPALQSYQTFLDQTYNPAVREISSVRSSFDLPAASAAFQATAQDTGFVDRAASDTKAVYDASQEEYSRLQAAYQGMAPQLSEYTRQAEAAKQQVLSLQGMAPELQRSLAIDTEARKRGTRRDYRQSVLTGDFKRRGSAR